MTRQMPHLMPDPAAEVHQPLRRSLTCDQLSASGALAADTIFLAQQSAARLGLRVEDVLYAQHGLSHRALVEAQTDRTGSQLIDPLREPPDPRLVLQLGPASALRKGVLPWRRLGGCVVVLAPSAEQFARHHAALTALFGDVRVAFTTEDHISRCISTQFASHLIRRAENRVPRDESCRTWAAPTAMRLAILLVSALLAAAIFAPVTTLTVMIGLTVLILALSTGIKTAAAIVGRKGLPTSQSAQGATLARLPVITVLIPLYHEKAIAEHLLNRLEAIDYPRELLDVCLVMEASDHTTRNAVGRARLLTWMRLITVPDGTIKTKPRALNYALDFARGSIIGVYDAEDAPAPDQLRKVAQHFANAPPNVVCLQGTLDYYNARANWLTRCFTIEYAAWFRVILPGYARMGLVVPLGGTTLFFRRDALEKLGAWDAHNVTEDADLGIRLARHGYRTEFVHTVTEEEANGRFWPWVKQRSRWLKGYAITYGVHMRDPVRLWRDLGAWRFFGLQILFAGTLAQFLLSPLLWSFWLIPFGVPHPIQTLLPPAAFWGFAGLFVATEVAALAIAWVALGRAGKRGLWPWALSLQLYFPLATIAAYKGLLELTWKPFYWDKTAHGVLLPGATRRPRPSARPASDGSQTP